VLSCALRNRAPAIRSISTLCAIEGTARAAELARSVTRLDQIGLTFGSQRRKRQTNATDQ
jgi:hypothetical protein